MEIVVVLRTACGCHKFITLEPHIERFKAELKFSKKPRLLMDDKPIKDVGIKFREFRFKGDWVRYKSGNEYRVYDEVE